MNPANLEVTCATDQVYLITPEQTTAQTSTTVAPSVSTTTIDTVTTTKSVADECDCSNLSISILNSYFVGLFGSDGAEFTQVSDEYWMSHTGDESYTLQREYGTYATIRDGTETTSSSNIVGYAEWKVGKCINQLDQSEWSIRSGAKPEVQIATIECAKPDTTTTSSPTTKPNVTYSDCMTHTVYESYIV